ncbi:DUF1932 domain-containing protein [Burkholderia sp. PU8-34]
MDKSDDPLRWHVGLIGYGEVGRILAEDLAARGVARISTYDVKVGKDDARLREHAEQYGVHVVDSHENLAASADLIISAVTASQTISSAEACASAVRPAAWYLDFNSASPEAKIRAASAITSAGGQYVEGAVMTSVPPYRIRVPIRLGGGAASQLEPHLTTLGFDVTVASTTLGVASATKMCRSVMIKGLEALVIESFTAARAYGVEDDVIKSLTETFPEIDWEKHATYFFQRVIEHGRRRAEEMLEAAETVRNTGLTPWAASATAERQSWVAQLADKETFSYSSEAELTFRQNWRADADKILKDLRDS